MSLTDSQYIFCESTIISKQRKIKLKSKLYFVLFFVVVFFLNLKFIFYFLFAKPDSIRSEWTRVSKRHNFKSSLFNFPYKLLILPSM